VTRIMPHSQGVKEVALLRASRDLDTHALFPGPGPGNQTVPANSEEAPCDEFNNDNRPCCHVAITAKEAALQEEQEDLKNAGDKQTIKRLSRKETSEYYDLMHRRFGHIGPDQLRNLHKVTKLKRPIVVPTEKEICRVCKLTKLRNRTNKTLSP
jgi:hypothetical protein